MSTQFDAIYLNNQIGKFRVAASGLGWKAAEGDEPITTVKTEDIKYAQWTRVARGYQLQLGLKNGSRKKFDGFVRDDQERLTNRFQNELSIQIETRDITVRGWNWGKAEIQGADLAFNVGSNAAFYLPLEHVQNTTITKQEVTIEILGPQTDTRGMTDKELKKKRKTEPDELVEMRLYVPGTASAARKRAKAAVKAEDGGDVEMADASDEPEDADDDEQSAAQTLHDELKDKADLNSSVGTPMVSFSEVHCLTPRGRYDLDLYSTFFRLRNKSYDYKILYTSFQRCFMLPKTDDINIAYVINLEPPIRQGQTRYPFLVMQFPKDEELKCEINLSEEERAEYQNLHAEYDAPAFEVISTIFTALTRKKNVTPSGNFRANEEKVAVKCNLKTAEGHLYFMEKTMVFLSKQPLVIPYGEIGKVRFERVTGSLIAAKTFDMRVEMRDATDMVFSAVLKEEQSHITEFLTDKHVKVKQEVVDEMVETGQALAAALAEDGDDSSGEESDAAPKRDKGKAAAGADEDEDSEVDEDFQGGDSGSSVAEEYDEHYRSSGEESNAMDVDDSPKPAKKSKKKQGSDAGSDAPKPKKAKAKPKAKKSSDAGGSDASPPPKKKKKTSDD